MNSKKAFYGLLGTLGLVAIIIVVTIVIGDKILQKQSDKLVKLKLDHQVIETQQLALGQAKKDLQKYNDLESIAKQIVPQDKDQARATREIINLANQAGIKIASLGFPASNLGQAVPKAATPTAGTTTPTPAPAAPSVTQVKPVDGIKNLLQLDIAVASDPTEPATYAKLIDFLDRLEQNRRTAQVSQISIQPDSKNRSALNFSLIITLYIKP